MATVLCVADEPTSSLALEHHLTRLGHRFMGATDMEGATRILARTPIDLVVADYDTLEGPGLELVGKLEQAGHEMPVILVTEASNLPQAISAMRGLAMDCLAKPIQPESLEVAVARGLEIARLRRENGQLRLQISQARAGRTLVEEGGAFRRLLEAVTEVAPTTATVLIEGEPGTGKRLLARAIHDRSPRQRGPYVAVNCHGDDEGRLARLLFGQEREAFAGATTHTAGALERADGGTLVLEEIAGLPLDLQERLLRLVQDGEFERVGGHHPVMVDIRLLATTSRDLQAEMAADRFRKELYYRVRMVPIRVPPLRERKDEIPLLAQHFARRAAEEIGVPMPAIGSDVLELLAGYGWPGNIRELANLVERAVILARGGMLTAEAFRGIAEPAPIRHPTAVGLAAERRVSAGAVAVGADLTQHVPATVPTDPYNLDELERRAIARALEATGGNRTRAAKLLGISERTLRNKLNGPREGPTAPG